MKTIVRSSTTNKEQYIEEIVSHHPLYTSHSGLANKMRKDLKNLSEDALYYLRGLIADKILKSK